MIRAVALAVALCACESVPDITYVDSGACPTVVPGYADICCQAIPCKGAGCVAACDDCAKSCSAADLCCPNAQARAVCRPNLQCQ